VLATLTLDDNTASAVALLSTASPYKRNIMTASGLYGLGTLRDSKRVRPQAHGGISETRYQDGQTISLDGEISSAVSMADAYNEWRTVMSPMLQTLDSGAALLKWSEVGGLALQRLVKLDSFSDPVLQEAAAVLHYQVQFFAEDPRAYSQTLTTVTGTALSAAAGGMVMPFTFPFKFSVSGGGTASFTNTGNRPTPPIFRAYGRAVNANIVNLSTGKRIALIGTVNSGDYLELDASKRTIKLNGLTLQMNFFDAANSSWEEVPPGATYNYQLVASDFDGSARLDVLGRAAYA
jgi:hypothetical protein